MMKKAVSPKKKNQVGNTLDLLASELYPITELNETSKHSVELEFAKNNLK